MRKLVGSIVAVCFVQIGFQLYTVVERTNDNFASVSEAVPASEWQASIADVEDAFQGSTGVEDTYIARSETHRAAFRRSQTTARPLTARTSTKLLFPTVVINIPPQERYEFTAYKPQAKPAAPPDSPATRPPSTKAAEPKKRSILAKAVKKPYDFLKFVASKLN